MPTTATVTDRAFFNNSPEQPEATLPSAEMLISIVIPALNEEQGIASVLQQIPHCTLKQNGYDVEVVVVDNGSTDNTARIAKEHGAIVISEPARGYGHAYMAGFKHATGDIIVTGDADMTYPFDALPELLSIFRAKKIQFMNTNRLCTLQPNVMTRTHQFGNWGLTLAMRILYGAPFRDSQSGMWLFERSIWKHLDVRSGGMPFSQELKVEAYMRGFTCGEVPITYRARVGHVKLNTLADGFRNITNLMVKRLAFVSIRLPRRSALSQVR